MPLKKQDSSVYSSTTVELKPQNHFFRNRTDSYGEIYERATKKLLHSISTLTEDSYPIRKNRILSENKRKEQKPSQAV